MDLSFVPELLAFNANLRLAHWQADSTTNDHRTLGDLYEAWDGLTDTLVEMVLGKEGTRAVPGAEMKLEADFSLKTLLTTGEELIGEVRDQFEPGEDDDALNVLADMSAALNKAKYLLKL